MRTTQDKRIESESRPKPVGIMFGNFVNWHIYRTFGEAEEAAEFAKQEGSLKKFLGYNFGNCCPGDITEIKPDSPVRNYSGWNTNLDNKKTYYRVTVP